MDNNNQNNEDPKEKKGGTLDLKNISISTLKDDLAKGNEEQKGDSAGWFNFLAKHKGEQDKNAVSEVTTQPNQEVAPPAADSMPAGFGSESDQNFQETPVETKELPQEDDSLLERELDEYKMAVEGSKSLAGEEPSTKISVSEAPDNLPVAESADMPANQINDSAGLSQGKISLPEETDKQEQVSERPTLGSFFPPREPEETEQGDQLNNKLAVALSGNSGAAPEEPTSLASDITEKTPAYSLGGENQGSISQDTDADSGNQSTRINPMPKEGIAGSVVETEDENISGGNPFSARIQVKEEDKKSLLHDVESALNYSAPPEFSQERNAEGSLMENGESQEISQDESGKVVDLRKKKTVPPSGFLANRKRLIIILGGVGGLVVIIIVVLALVLGGNKQTQQKVQTPVASQENQNQNAASPANQIKTTTPSQAVKPTLTPRKFLANSQEIKVGSISAIAESVQKIRESQIIKKQTQLIFLKSDGSSISLQDLMEAVGINIPRRVAIQPSAVPAMFFADFFHEKTVFGLVIPTSDAPDLALSKMRDWESTMVVDLDQLWKGIDIDNKNAYFADSQIFEGGRFALVDKKNKLSLDYLVNNGYILIACGKDSMTILNNNFVTGASSGNNGDTGSGIQWENSTDSSNSGTGSQVGENGNINAVDTTGSNSTLGNTSSSMSDSGAPNDVMPSSGSGN